MVLKYLSYLTMSPVKVINSRLILISILVFITLFFRTYHLKDRYIFDWDQEDDANKVMEMVKTMKPRLIGPRVANESGFFVGPFHYYFLTPFFILTKGNPYFGAYATVFVSMITTIVMYLIFENIFNSNIAFISTLFYATSANITSWNVIYTPLLSILIFYLCYQLLVIGKKKLFPLLIFLYSFSFTTHLVPAVLIIPIIISIIISRIKLNKKQIILSLILPLIPLTPLIIFDLRHNFINILTLKNFILSPKQVSEYVPLLFLRSFWRSINFIYSTNPIPTLVIRILIILISLFEIFRTKNSKLKLLFLVWILAPLLILSLYSGNIPEYYYGTSLILIPIFIALFINRLKNKAFFLLFITLILAFQLRYFSIRFYGITLKNKLDLTKYLVFQTQDKIFNLSYDLPLGLNSGFGYLFKYFGKEPQNIPEGHLYSVYLTSGTPSTGQIVYSNNVFGLVRK